MDARLEKRLSPRRNCMINATIIFDGGRRKEACIIRNISDSGAKIELGTLVAKIPNSFDMLVAKHRPQKCRVVWRTMKEMGIQFEFSHQDRIDWL